VPAPVVAAQWLLAFHITGGFLLLGGAAAAAVLNALAWRTDRPSEIALLLRLIRFTVPLIGLGALLTLVLGLWLVHHDGFSYGAFWVWAAVILWMIGNALGGRGGRMQQQAREEAERCAADGDVSTDRLRELLRDPVANGMSWASGVAILLVLVLMIWKPGS
jgi:uncharacterized membrane protein